MKSIFTCIFIFVFLQIIHSAPMKSFYGFKMKTIDGKEIDFSTFKNKKVLIIIGFPSNDFGAQEP